MSGGTRRNLIALAAFAVVLVLFFFLRPTSPPIPKTANILFISADALRADHLGLYGHSRATSPVLDQFAKKWKGNHISHLRNPSFIAVGEFRKKAHQPIWFSQPKEILDTDGVIYGPKGTASVAMYPSLTEHKGARVLWYPDRKHFLLGLNITDDMLSDMNAPEQ